MLPFRAGACPALLAVLSIGLLGGCDALRPAKPEPPVRLFDRLDELELVEGRGARDFSGMRRSPLAVTPKPPIAVASVSRPLPDGYDRRPALVVAAGSRMVWTPRLPESRQPRELRVAVAAISRKSGKEISAVVRVEAGGARRELDRVTEVRVTADREAPWQEIVLELPEGPLERIQFSVADGPAGGAFAAPQVVSRWKEAGRSPRFDLLLISLDTLRADRLGVYGYTARPTSPNLDRFAGQTIRFASAISQAPWTRPSHRAMLSGVYPASRGGLVRRLLATELWKIGFRTSALTSGGQIDSRFNFDEGFERYAVDRHWLRSEPGGFDALDAAGNAPGQPSFLFLHTYEIHDPYTDRRFLKPGDCPGLGESFSARGLRQLGRNLTDEEKACVAAFYDGDVAYTDERMGRLLARLDASPRRDDTIVVVTSDHGEELWDHGGWRHGADMYEHQIHVPLFLRLPPRARESFAAGTIGRAGVGVVEEPVALVDLPPSLYELLGVSPAPPMHGRSFLPLLAGGKLEPREIFSENTNHPRFERKSIRTPRFKLIRGFSRIAGGPLPARALQLFELSIDPREQNDIAAQRPEIVRALQARLDRITGGGLGDLDDENGKGVDAELKAELEALGYIGN